MSTDARETPGTEAKLNELHRGDPISTMGAFSEMAIFARQLERELAEARDENSRLLKENVQFETAAYLGEVDRLQAELTHLRVRVQAAEGLELFAVKITNWLKGASERSFAQEKANRGRFDGLADACNADGRNFEAMSKDGYKALAAFRATEGRRA